MADRDRSLGGRRNVGCKSITRYLRLLTGGRARTDYHAQYHMNVATPAILTRLKCCVGRAMLRF